MTLNLLLQHSEQFVEHKQVLGSQWQEWSNLATTVQDGITISNFIASEHGIMESILPVTHHNVFKACHGEFFLIFFCFSWIVLTLFFLWTTQQLTDSPKLIGNLLLDCNLMPAKRVVQSLEFNDWAGEDQRVKEFHAKNPFYIDWGEWMKVLL